MFPRGSVLTLPPARVSQGNSVLPRLTDKNAELCLQIISFKKKKHGEVTDLSANKEEISFWLKLYTVLGGQDRDTKLNEIFPAYIGGQAMSQLLHDSAFQM